MYELLPESQGTLVGMRISDNLSTQDLEAVANDLQPFIQANQHFNVLILMDNFRGWESISAALKDLKIDMQANQYIDRIAMVGQTEWEEWLAWFSKAFVRGELKYFERDQLDEAWAWARGET